MSLELRKRCGRRLNLLNTVHRDLLAVRAKVEEASLREDLLPWTNVLRQ